MQVLMGGSGSTGSSLLKNILNRHSDIFAGEETAFFAKRMIYTHWKKAAKRVLKKGPWGLRNYGWHLYNGTHLLQKEYLATESDLQNMLLSSKSLVDFTSQFYAQPLAKKNAHIWLEKTPANAANFNAFLNTFDKGKVVHIVRNPYDTIASLYRRGFNVYYATGTYLLNTACGLSTMGLERAYTIFYEDLVGDTATSVRRLCDFIGIDYQKNILFAEEPKMNEGQMQGWQYNENQKIGKKSIGRFKSLSEEEQQMIIEATNAIHITKAGQQYYGVNINSVKDITTSLAYDFHDCATNASFSTLQSFKRKDRLTRLSRAYPTGLHYPLGLKV